jgi:hypothetical protein
MSDVFAERPFPGERAPYDVGPWEDFEVDSAWSDSLLRVRSIYGGRAVQFAGTIVAQLSEGTDAWLGVLSPVFWPSSAQNFIVPIAYAEWADLEIKPDGQVVLRSRSD